MNYTNSPLPKGKKGHSQEGYLFFLNSKAAEFIMDEIENKNEINLEESVIETYLKRKIEKDRKLKDKTHKKREIDTRTFQSEFRKDVLKLWKNKCCITKLKEKKPSLLIASHIKKVKYSSEEEMQDKYNGLPLTPSYDRAFEGHYISFDDNGKIVKSSKISIQELNKLGISLNTKISGLNSKHKKYLEWHRDRLKK